MAGFFDIKETTVPVSEQIGLLPKCGRCKARTDRQCGELGITGEGRKKILLIAESPTREEAINEDRWWFDDAGKLLENLLTENNIDIYKDCWTVNAVACPVHSLKITKPMIKNCAPIVHNAITKLKPSLIIPMGTHSLHSLLLHRSNKGIGSINRYVGHTIPDQLMKSWVCPVYCPKFVYSYKHAEICELLFKKQIQKALSVLGSELPEKDVRSKFRIIKGKAIGKLLGGLIGANVPVAFDYETTGIKPHRKGHRILSVGVCNDVNIAYAWKWDQNYASLWCDFLQSSVPKIAANKKFETTWSRQFCNSDVENWYFDTMLASHVLDNRTGTTSVKFQTYVRYGLLGYDAAVDAYKKAEQEEEDKYGANAFNRMQDCPTEMLLEYNALDALFEFWLAQDMIEELKQLER